MSTKIVGSIGIILLITMVNVTTAQISLNVPNNTENTRFYNDVFNTNRPALSIVGFDNGGNNNKGYGLKQILEMLYNGSVNSLMVNNYDEIVSISKNLLTNPFDDPDRSKLSAVNRNSNILQSRAFVALA